MGDWALMSMAPRQPGNFPQATPDTAGIPGALKGEMLIAPFNDIDTVASLVREHGTELAGVSAAGSVEIARLQVLRDEALVWLRRYLSRRNVRGEIPALAGLSRASILPLSDEMLSKLEHVTEGFLGHEAGGQCWLGVRSGAFSLAQPTEASVVRDMRHMLKLLVGNIIGEPIEVHGIARGRAKNELVAQLLERVGHGATLSGATESGGFGVVARVEVGDEVVDRADEAFEHRGEDGTVCG
jgi:hypothetical protein